LRLTHGRKIKAVEGSRQSLIATILVRIRKFGSRYQKDMRRIIGKTAFHGMSEPAK
jgi:hypothetical protein